MLKRFQWSVVGYCIACPRPFSTLSKIRYQYFTRIISRLISLALSLFLFHTLQHDVPMLHKDFTALAYRHQVWATVSVYSRCLGLRPTRSNCTLSELFVIVNICQQIISRIQLCIGICEVLYVFLMLIWLQTVLLQLSKRRLLWPLESAIWGAQKSYLFDLNIRNWLIFDRYWISWRYVASIQTCNFGLSVSNNHLGVGPAEIVQYWAPTPLALKLAMDLVLFIVYLMTIIICLI